MVRKEAACHSTPRQRRREETLARITETALDIAVDEGLQALTIQRLAQEVGYAVGALYRYFPSKDAILLAVQRRVIDAIHADLRAALARTEAHLARSRALSTRQAALLRPLVVAEVYLGLAERRPEHFRLLALFLGDTEPLIANDEALTLLPTLLALMQEVAALFDDAVAAGALAAGDAAQRAVLLWAAVHGVGTLRKLGRFGVDALAPEALHREVVAGLLRGWGAEAKSIHELRTRAARLAGEIV